MTILYGLLIVLMIVGVAGAVIPALPGSSLILAGVVIWGVVAGFSGLGWALGVAVAVAVLSIGIDILATYWGAKQAGVSKWGQIGAIVGLLVGMLGLLPAWILGGPILGIIIGALLGAIVGEYLYRRDFTLAFKAGISVVVSSLVGNLIQGMLALVAVVVFLLTTWP
ncbi:MAG: DUF456 family protein, partial [Geitlerinemataceae cyanobacterium]